ncbi:hypothetical protein JMJ35_000765 [Cladonia borealis]|uniref:Beta-lactamase-related domain-containing protein n=1 Tax=Cladonia borealis TaxID=184061 RepID=A0AA39V4W1_9LECA|nr:hypothetical protein JMJ35_000765 [Cladonia borealis]
MFKSTPGHKATAGPNPHNEMQQRFKNLSPTVNEILRISGTAGASVGILHSNEVIYTANFGYRDVDQKLPPTQDTIYYIASLSKFMTAAGIGQLVEEGELQWNDMVSAALPKFQHRKPQIRDHATLVDILSHRTGLAPKMHLWMGEHSRPQMTGHDFTKTTTYLETVSEFRSKFIYNNCLYGLAAQIIERISRQKFGEFIESNFFEPLGMHRTRIHGGTADLDNVAEPYMYNEGSPYLVRKPPIDSDSAMEGAAGVKSSVRDLLKYYKSLLDAREQQQNCGCTSTDDSPFKQVQELLTERVTMDDLPAHIGKTSYALGWAVVQLPAALGSLSGNGDLVEEMPWIGEGLSEKPTVLYHGGSRVGYLSYVLLLPETKSAIIVLVNTLANQDSADWIGQAFLEALLDVPSPHDFVQLANGARDTKTSLFPKMHRALAEGRKSGTFTRSLHCYQGQFENAVGTFILDVYVFEEELYLSLNGYRKEKHKLYYYDGDTLSFELGYLDCLKREIWPKTDKEYYLLEFLSNENGDIKGIKWRPDLTVPQGEDFARRT